MSTTGFHATLGQPGDTTTFQRPLSPSPESPLLLGARLTPVSSPGRSRSLPGLQVASRGLTHTAIRREKSLSSVTAVLPRRPIHVPPVEGIQGGRSAIRAPSASTRASREEAGMWKMIHGGPHPHSHWDKKMWSPGPPPPRDPIKLPFLDVTPTSVLQRLRDRSTPDSEVSTPLLAHTPLIPLLHN